MKRYVVLLACDPGDWASASPAVQQEYFDAHQAFERYVDAHGRRISSAPLAGADTATTLRHADGSLTVTDGPFVESVEQVAGYYDVELPDLDSAIAAGRLLPASYAVEIRPTVTIEGYEPA
ncbi:YciI family protein [Nocardioides ferulae]|uniref:YciI family protein n=1 Tax=Nocardioides ferulae TaxID=2340821 RepID=UPI000EADF61D|nr:YciI family protein [Nocardioides ferulae]